MNKQHSTLILKTAVFTALIMLLFLLPPVNADFVASYGSDPGKVAFVNQKSHPGLQIPIPYGPRAFRIIGEDCWIIDSVGGKLLRFNKTSGFVSEHRILDNPEEMIFEDISPIIASDSTISGWWTIDLKSSSLLQLDSSGKIVRRIKSPEFKQPFRVELGQSNEVFLADKGAGTIFQINSTDGSVIKKTKWEWSGFDVGDKTGTLYQIMFSSKEQASILVGTTSQMKQTVRIKLSLPLHYNPELQWVDEDRQECVLTYINHAPGHPNHKRTVAVRVAFDGRIKGSAPINMPNHLNRFLDRGNGKPYVASANYAESPMGNLCIKRFFLP
ncbi:MAG: hypothetical protein HQM10_08240 [Candidatus Riflebacteria bacterium]|nr:hypothetical protein [Candidatus Riflebacteria bacterium]